jgi:hypothetical protein
MLPAWLMEHIVFPLHRKPLAALNATEPPNFGHSPVTPEVVGNIVRTGGFDALQHWA